MSSAPAAIVTKIAVSHEGTASTAASTNPTTRPMTLFQHAVSNAIGINTAPRPLVW